MNPVTFNNVLIAHCPPVWMAGLKEDAPIFTLGVPEDWDSSSRNIDFCKSLESRPHALPFIEVRLFFAGKMGGGIFKIKAWMRQLGSVLKFAWHVNTDLGEADWIGFTETIPGKAEFMSNIFRSRKISHDQVDGEFSRFADSILFLTAWMIEQIDSGASYIAAVRPENKGKSIQWTESRTHYVLIHRTHPANNATLERGREVKEDTAYIKRQAHSRRAHSRRAHFRILRSPKFRHKMGQKIRIKSCWVGPKEWKQGNSVYVLRDDLSNFSKS